MRIGIASDHGGFSLKEEMSARLKNGGIDVADFGPVKLDPADDYPDFVLPLSFAVASGEIERGIAICGSGVGASVAANKVKKVRAALIHDAFSAHQGVEDDNINVLCLGGRVIGNELAWEIIEKFLSAKFSGAERHKRRLAKVANISD